MSKPRMPSDPATGLGSRGSAIRELVGLLRRRGWVLPVCVILIPAAIYLYTDNQPRVYEAKVVVQPRSALGKTTVPGTDDVSNPFEPSPEFVAAYARTPRVAGETVALLGRPSSAGGLGSRLDADTGWVTLTATGSDPRQSVTTVNAYARALSRVLDSAGQQGRELLIRATTQSIALERNSIRRARLIKNLRALRNLDAPGQNLEVIQPAIRAGVVSPHPRRNAGLAVILALLVAPALMALLERFDRRIRTPSELAGLAGVPLLATIPRDAFQGDGSARPTFGAFQTLRDRLLYSKHDRPLTRLVVVSPLEGEGRTVVATNLAAAFARAGKRVVLIDADLRGPGLALRLGVPARPGLTDVLMSGDLHSALHQVPGLEGYLTVLPAGATPPDPAEILGSAPMSSLLDRLTQECDLVVIDTAPLLEVSDALPLLPAASGVVSLGRLNNTPRDAVRRMRQMTTTAGAPMLGIVATGASPGRHRLLSRASRARRGQDRPQASIPGRFATGVPEQ